MNRSERKMRKNMEDETKIDEINKTWKKKYVLKERNKERK